MKKFRFPIAGICPALLLAAVVALSSCEDDMSGIGGSLSKGEVVISIDSTQFKIKGHSVAAPVIDARSTTNMLGSINVPGYGRLHCSFVSGMLSASTLNIPDTIPADSVCGMSMTLSIPRNSTTGDTLSPQQLKLYRLIKPLPDSITNQFDPAPYYTPASLLATKNYVASAAAMKDSAFSKLSTLPVKVDLPQSLAVSVFNEYRNNPGTFAWPQTFARFFAGIYAENSFGSGCVVNVSKVTSNIYWRNTKPFTEYKDSTYKTGYRSVIDSLTIFSTAPEVLSSNIISLEPDQAVKQAVADSMMMLQSPAGYNVRLRFPAKEIVEAYRAEKTNMSVVNNLILTIPVEPFDNRYGIVAPPYLLMVKTKDLASFFANNRVPDDKTSFWASYDSKRRQYTFTSMRSYIVDMLKLSEPAEEDMDFTLVPVNIVTESTSYGSTVHTYVTSCVPYLTRPTLCRLLPENAQIKFTYSGEVIE